MSAAGGRAAQFDRLLRGHRDRWIFVLTHRAKEDEVFGRRNALMIPVL
jgi:hypothetical protein